MTKTLPKKAILKVKPAPKLTTSRKFYLLEWESINETSCCGMSELHGLSCSEVASSSLSSILTIVNTRLLSDFYMPKETANARGGHLVVATTAVQKPEKMTKNEINLETALKNANFEARTIFKNKNTGNTVTVWHKYL